MDRQVLELFYWVACEKQCFLIFLDQKLHFKITWKIAFRVGGVHFFSFPAPCVAPESRPRNNIKYCIPHRRCQFFSFPAPCAAPENIPRNNIKYCILCRRGLFFYTPDTLCLLRRSHFFLSLLIEIQCLVILIGIVVVTVVLAISVAISISVSLKMQ